jgi:hypothetical protein
MEAVLPGDDLIRQGLADLDAGNETVAAWLVCIGSPRLRRLGFELPSVLPTNPEERLYDMLATIDPVSAHSRYNMCIEKLVRFEKAAEIEQGITLGDKLLEFLDSQK